LKFFRIGNDLVATGFLVFSIGESVLLSGTAAGPAGSAPAFAAGAVLAATALLLISIPKEFAIAVRVIGLVTAALFIVTSARIFLGEQLLLTTSPLPFSAYPFLVLTLLGWMSSVL
jgi:hypothetical protein